MRAKSARIVAALTGAEGVKGVSGLGLMLGIATERKAEEVLADLREEGVLALKAKDKVRLLPPLSISDDELDRAIEIIRKVCAK